MSIVSCRMFQHLIHRAQLVDTIFEAGCSIGSVRRRAEVVFVRPVSGGLHDVCIKLQKQR